MHAFLRTAARAAHRALAIAPLALVATLGACADEPTKPTLTGPALEAPRLATLPSPLSGPVLVTVKGIADEAAWPYSMGLEGIIPFDRLGSFSFEYQYVMPDPNMSGHFFTYIDSAFTIRSLDRNGNVLATFTAGQQGQFTNVAAWDDVTSDFGTSDFYHAGLEASDMSGRPITFSVELWPGQPTTDIIPGDPARYISLDAWDNTAFRVYYGRIEDGTYRTPGIAITSLEVTVEPYTPPSADADHDGVPDANDQCPNTGAGSSVNTNGCAPAQLDTDTDGVNDALDKCPATPTGSTVNTSGCTPAQAIDLAVPCAGPAAGGTWASHGAYVSAVAAYADQLVKAGVITEGEKSALVSARAKSACGSSGG